MAEFGIGEEKFQMKYRVNSSFLIIIKLHSDLQIFCAYSTYIVLICAPDCRPLK